VYETNFWLAINIILTIVIVGLVYRQYLASRQSKTSDLSPLVEGPDLSNSLKIFHDRLADTDVEKAVYESFQDVLKQVLPQGKFSGSTLRELLASNTANLSGEVLDHLRKMYDVYEPVRYGGHRPTDLELGLFKSSLESLIAHVRVWRSVTRHV
jgi:hypothetical protein